MKRPVLFRFSFSLFCLKSCHPDRKTQSVAFFSRRLTIALFCPVHRHNNNNEAGRAEALFFSFLQRPYTVQRLYGGRCHHRSPPNSEVLMAINLQTRRLGRMGGFGWMSLTFVAIHMRLERGHVVGTVYRCPPSWLGALSSRVEEKMGELLQSAILGPHCCLFASSQRKSIDQYWFSDDKAVLGSRGQVKISESNFTNIYTHSLSLSLRSRQFLKKNTPACLQQNCSMLRDRHQARLLTCVSSIRQARLEEETLEIKRPLCISVHSQNSHDLITYIQTEFNENH